MLKALWLSILGWFRTKAEEGTDLRYAGKEQFSRNQASIENVRKQRNSLAGDHLLLKKSITKTSTTVDEATTAFQKWTAEENKEKADWDAMTPKQRESIAIKKLWVAPCKEWMCQN